MLGIYQKQLFMNEDEIEFQFMPKEICPYVENGCLLCRSDKIFFPNQSPVVIEGTMKEDIFVVNRIRFPTNNREEAFFFLSQMEKKLTKETKDKILAITGNDLFAFAMKENAELKIPGVKDTILKELLFRIRQMMDKKELAELLFAKKIPPDVIKKIVESKLTLRQIRKNPFRTAFGISPFDAEKIAEKLNPYDKNRINGFVGYALETSMKEGNSFDELSEIWKRINRLLKRSAFPQISFSISMIYGAIQNMKTIQITAEKKQLCVYAVKALSQEKKIAEQIHRLMKNPVPVVKKLDFPQIEKETGFHYNEGQKKAFSSIKTSGVKVITGPPGSGKTALIKGLLLAYQKEHPNDPAFLSATTGAAAQVLGRACGKKGQTVHKMLGLRPCGDYMLCKNESDPIPSHFIIVDEVSMLDLETASYLFPAVQNGSILLLVGDDNQLESVGYGRVLADLIESGKVEVYYLTQVMRQSGIICENAAAIRKGSFRIRTSEFFSVRQFSTEKEAVECMMQSLSIRHSYVLSPVKKLETAGVYALNERIQNAIKNKVFCFSYRKTKYFLHDKIIMLHTNYDAGYFNGDIGEICDYENGTVTIQFADKTLLLHREHFADMQLAYCLTVHKAQGSEIDDVHIILPASPKNMLTRKILYTAITRAKKHVFIYYVKDSLSYAITTVEKARKSNLSTRI